MSNPDEIPTEEQADHEQAENEPVETAPENEVQESAASQGSVSPKSASVASSPSEHSRASSGTKPSPATSKESGNSESRPSPATSIEYPSKRCVTAIQFAEEPEEQPCRVLYDLSDADLLNTFQELETILKRVKTENHVFCRFLEQNEPEALDDMVATLALEKLKSAKSSAAAARRTKPPPSKGSHVSVPQSHPSLTLREKEKEKEPPKININQKSDLVMRDLEELQARVEVRKTKLNKMKRDLIAKLEESEARKDELEKSKLSFETFQETADPVTLLKFARFMDEWSKKSRLMADKLRLRYSSSRVQYQKLAATLAHKQLVGENLQAIDFENLKVENAHLADKIEKKTLLLIELKRMTGAGNLKLSQHKAVLQQKMAEKEAMEKAIKRVKRDISKSDNEIVKLFQELDQVRAEHSRVKQKYRSYESPDLMLYVRKKMEVDGFRKDLTAWTRRRSFKEKALEIELNSMKKLLRRKQPHPSWFE